MRRQIRGFILLCSLLLWLAALHTQTVAMYKTTSDLKQALQKGRKLRFTSTTGADPVITVDDSRQFQTMDGFGAAMTDSSAWLLEEQLTAAQHREVMRRLFDPRHGIGVSFVRVPLGASDLAHSHYSYDDMPPARVIRARGSSPSNTTAPTFCRHCVLRRPSIRVFSCWGLRGARPDG